MATVPLNVKINVQGGGDLKRILGGITKENAKVEQAARKEIEKTESMRRRSIRDQEIAAKQLTRVWQRAGASIRRELQASVFGGMKRGIDRARQYIKQNRAQLGIAAITGGAIAGRQAFNTARGITGAPSIQENIANAKQFEFQLTALQNQSQLSPTRIKEIESQIQKQAGRGTISPNQLLAGVEAVQRLEGADAIDDFLKSMDSTAMFAEGLQADFESLAKLSTIINRQFGVRTDEIDDALGMLAEAGVQGSVELENFSQQFPRVMGMFNLTTGRGGMQGLQEFAAVSQAVATAFPDAPEMAATATNALIRQLGDTKTQKILRQGAGVDVRSNTIPEIAQALFNSPLSDKQMEKAFPNVRALTAMGALMNQYSPGTDNVLSSVLAADGAGQVSRASDNARRIRGTQRGQDLIRANEMQARMIDNFEDTASAARNLTEWFDKLASEFPGSILVAQTLSTFITSIGVATIALNAMGAGGMAKKAMGGAKNAASAVGGAAAANSAVINPALGAIGVAGLGLGVGAALAHATNEEKLLSFAESLGFNSDALNASEQRRMHEEQIRAQKENTTAVRNLANSERVGRAE
jgi:hypothetical protein